MRTHRTESSRSSPGCARQTTAPAAGHALHKLQRALGNRTVGRLLRARQPAPAASDVPAVVHDVLRAPGQPLADAVREPMEERFGRDFGSVRVHTDTRAAESAAVVRARAYTAGPHIVFNAGRYQPGSAAGRRLLAHELTHVVQQGGRAPTSSA